MTTNSKTFRLFLSSTFNDMRAERDALQEKVFPRLRAYCNERGFSFTPIDLRWGVSSEAGDDQKTMQICIDEVKRCKDALTPHFAIMLGERYGWIPLPASIEANEFELVKEVLLNKGDEKVKEYINQWYKKDTNTVPAVYKLQPKVEKKHKDWEYWGDVESTLRDAFKEAVNNELKNKLTDTQKQKYITSATEQEIIEGLFNNVEHKENIYFYNRNFKNIDKLSKDEFKQLEQKDKEYRKKDNSYQITIKHFSDFKNFTEDELDDEIRPYHINLINHIKEQLPQENTKEYTLDIDTTLERTQDSITQEYLDKFCEDFYNDVFKSMEKEIQNFQVVDKQIRELNSQETFLKEKSKIFVGREEILSKIDNYIQDDSQTAPLVIYADSGSGKSALMAKAISNATSKYTDATIAYRFVGTSELSNTPMNLYKSLYNEFIQNEQIANIAEEYINDNDTEKEKILSDIKELYKLFVYIFDNFDDKLILFVDALDQFVLDDNLSWLPRNLKSNIKIIISTLPDSYDDIKYLPKLKQKYNQSENFLFLEAFKSDEASSMIDDYLKANNKTLTKEQKQKLLDAFVQSGSPLYLKILLEEAKEWSSYTDVSNEEYPKELDKLVERLFMRLHTNFHQNLALINYAFSYIACSKDGLSEPELFDILTQEKEVMDAVSNEFYPRPQRLPTAVWARLYSQMSQYLSIKEIDGIDKISFFHRKFNEGAYSLLDTKEKTHKRLADFYEAVYNKTIDIQTTQESALVELPYQLIMSNQKEKALELLTNFEFLMKKFKLNKSTEVLEDYALAKAKGINDE